MLDGLPQTTLNVLCGNFGRFGRAIAPDDTKSMRQKAGGNPPAEKPQPDNGHRPLVR
jgi:hypothetical protein